MILTDLWMALGNPIVGAISLFVSAAAFVVAVWQIRKTQSADERAADAVTEAREAGFRKLDISQLAQAIALIEFLKELHRNGDFSRALDRYAPLRQLITSLQTRQTEEDKTSFGNAIIQLLEMEKTVRDAVYTGKQVNPAQFDSTLLNIQQMLDESRVKQQQSVPRESDIGGRSLWQRFRKKLLN